MLSQMHLGVILAVRAMLGALRGCRENRISICLGTRGSAVYTTLEDGVQHFLLLRELVAGCVALHSFRAPAGQLGDPSVMFLLVLWCVASCPGWPSRAATKTFLP